MLIRPRISIGNDFGKPTCRQEIDAVLRRVHEQDDVNSWGRNAIEESINMPLNHQRLF